MVWVRGLLLIAILKPNIASAVGKRVSLTDLRPDFGIFETMRVEDRQCRLLDLHLGRLNSSAQALNLTWPQNAAEQIQHYIDALPSGFFRVKAALFSDGLALSHAAVSELDGETIRLS